MVATEIFLIAAGVICVVVSVVMSFGDDKENVESSAKSELTQAQLDMVKHQVDEVIKQQISGLSEKTEAALDKISNTKILEMNMQRVCLVRLTEIIMKLFFCMTCLMKNQKK